MNIVLIGCRCVGKTTVGSQLAAYLQRRFVDTDHLIERRHGEIQSIVKQHGWPFFRALEKQVIGEVSTRDNLVIAPGGGFILDGDNVTTLKQNGFFIWLKADVEAVYQRMLRDPRTALQRPSLTGKGVLDELQDVMTHRGPLYEKAAEVHVDTSDMDVEAVVEGVLSVFHGMRWRQ